MLSDVFMTQQSNIILIWNKLVPNRSLIQRGNWPESMERLNCLANTLQLPSLCLSGCLCVCLDIVCGYSCVTCLCVYSLSTCVYIGMCVLCVLYVCPIVVSQSVARHVEMSPGSLCLKAVVCQPFCCDLWHPVNLSPTEWWQARPGRHFLIIDAINLSPDRVCSLGPVV